MEGSSSHSATSTPSMPDAGADAAVDVAQRPERAGPVQPGAGEQAEGLADEGAADQDDGGDQQPAAGSARSRALMMRGRNRAATYSPRARPIHDATRARNPSR